MALIPQHDPTYTLQAYERDPYILPAWIDNLQVREYTSEEIDEQARLDALWLAKLEERLLLERSKGR